MKSGFFLLIFGLFVGTFQSVYSQDLSNYYTYRVQEDGNLYFIFPFEDFKNSADKTDFAFDITYRAGRDSATVNFTYFTRDPLRADSLMIVNGETTYKGIASRIFQDFKKKKWENRFGIKIPMNELEAFIKTEMVPQIHVIGKDAILIYEVKDKKWRDYADAVDKILYIIRPDDE
jgi:hypothetical protein